METIGVILFLFFIGGITAEVGWDILEDYDWFSDQVIKYPLRRIAAYLALATIGIPFVWGFIILGIILAIIVSALGIIMNENFEN